MKRFLFAAFLAALVTVDVHALRGGGGSIDQGNVAITGGSIAGVSGVPVKLASWRVPVFTAPSGTMGNNGAITLGTALDRIYTEGIWLYLPAGAVAAGEPAAAAYRWCVMSSTTAGIVYNDGTFTGASVPVAGTPTAYSTTGPGAFTGITAITTAITITIPANSLGATGAVVGDWHAHHNSAAGNKQFDLFHTVTNYGGWVGSTQGGGGMVHTIIRNNGSGAQSGASTSVYASQILGSGGVKYGTADTTAATTLVIRFTNATATNWMGVVGGDFFTIR